FTLPTGVTQNGAPQPDGDLLDEVIRTGQPRYATTVNGETDAPWLAVPLSVQERVIGVLACLGPAGHVFSESQETLLTTLANQTALAIENARLVTSAAVV